MNEIYDLLHLILDIEKKLQGIYAQHDMALIGEVLQILSDTTDEIYQSVLTEFGEKYVVLTYLSKHRELMGQMLQAAEQNNEFGFLNLVSEAASLIEKSERMIKRTTQEDLSGQYQSLIYRPKCADEIGELSRYKVAEKIAIVIQGPIVYADDFTRETVRIYKKLYPDCDIIVSTWENEADYVPRLEEAGAVVCLSAMPDHSGYGNCSYQRVSTVAGIEKAMQMGAQYICKTRADERIYKADLFAYLHSLLQTFPLKMDTMQKERLITVSPFTMSNRLYNCSDLFTYGTAEDVMRYYASPLDARDNQPVEYVDAVQFARLRFGEAWFTTHYIESLGFKLKWTMEDSDYYRNNLFIILDAHMIDLYWPKYDDLEFGHKYEGIEQHEVTFLEWLHEQKSY